MMLMLTCLHAKLSLCDVKHHNQQKQNNSNHKLLDSGQSYIISVKTSLQSFHLSLHCNQFISQVGKIFFISCKFGCRHIPCATYQQISIGSRHTINLLQPFSWQV